MGDRHTRRKEGNEGWNGEKKRWIRAGHDSGEQEKWP